MSDELFGDEKSHSPRVWDFLLTTALIVVLAILTALFFFLGIGSSAATVSCEDAAGQCNDQMITLGSQLAVIGTPIVALIGVIVSIVRLVRRRIAFWVPIVTIAVGFGLFAASTYLVGEAVPV